MAGTATTVATVRSRAVLARLVAPLVVAAALTGVAVVTVERAGCDDPGRYEVASRGTVYVPGCLLPDGATDRPLAPGAPAGPDRAEGPDARRG